MNRSSSVPTRILVLGAGSHAQAVAELAVACGYSSTDFLDDSSPDAIAPLCDLERLAPSYPAVAIAIGNLPVRKALFARLLAIKAHCPALVHPAAYVSPSARIAPGSLVFPLALIHANASVGTAAIVSAGAILDHDATLADFAHLDAGAVLASRASVPSLVKIPAGQTVLPPTKGKVSPS